MARLRPEFVERVEVFSDRVVDVVDALDKLKAPYYLRNQMGRAGTSVGANTGEASEALSRKDFVKCLGTVLKELAETRYWLRSVVRRGYFPAERLVELQREAEELRLIFTTMAIRTRERNDRGDEDTNEPEEI